MRSVAVAFVAGAATEGLALSRSVGRRRLVRYVGVVGARWSDRAVQIGLVAALGGPALELHAVRAVVGVERLFVFARLRAAEAWVGVALNRCDREYWYALNN